MTATLKPYADDAASLSIGELSIENGRDSIAVHGNVDLTRDMVGLAHARALQAAMDAIVHALEGEHDLLAQIAPPKAAGEVKNPFG